jgi:hypothetical protein
MLLAMVTGVRSSWETFARKSALAVVSDSGAARRSRTRSFQLRAPMGLQREALGEPARDPGAEGDGARLHRADRPGHTVGPVGLRDVRGCAGLQHVPGQQGGRRVGPADHRGLRNRGEEPPDELTSGQAVQGDLGYDELGPGARGDLDGSIAVAHDLEAERRPGSHQGVLERCEAIGRVAEQHLRGHRVGGIGTHRGAG